MSKLFLLLFNFCFLYQAAICQSNSFADSAPKDNRYVIRNILWFNPSRANEINGISISGIIFPHLFHADSLKIRGINVGVEPEWLLAIPYIFVGAFASPFEKNKKQRETIQLDYNPDSAKVLVTISGINIGVCGSSIIESKTNGLSLSSIGTMALIHNGCALSLLMNKVYNFNGLLVAGLMNDSEKGNGVQIGLVNSCNDCSGLQIGLWNKMGKRGLPFINFNIRKKKQKV